MKTRIISQIIKRLSHLPKGNDRIKYIQNSLKLAIAKKAKLLRQPYPNAIMLEITNLCQLRCMTCAREHSFGKAMDKGHMDIQKAKGVIDEYHIYLDKIALTGLGEPLLYPHLKELVDYIREKNEGILLFLSTNAMHKKSVEIIDSIADKIDTLQISMDGWNDTFKGIRRGADFNQFVENVKGIVKASKIGGFDTKLNMVVFEDNYKEMKKVIVFAKEHGITEVCFNSFNLVSTDNAEYNYALYHSEQFQNELKEASNMAKQVDVFLEYPNISGKNSFSTCAYPWGNYSITWDGYLVPCCAKPFPKELNFGNVFRDGLLRCINHHELINFRKLSKRNVAPGFCRNCHHVEN